MLGTLVATKRQKSAIEASQLREKNATMAERIRALEDALAAAHAKTTNEIHTLLVNTDVEERMNMGGAAEKDGEGSVNNDVIDAFGTLSIGQDGRSKYHNQSAGADVRIVNFIFIFIFIGFMNVLILIFLRY
jgi:hypothetical protein